MKNRLQIFALLLFLLPTGCQAMVQKWQKDRLTSHLSRLKSYHGVLREKGVLESKEDLVSEIWFQQPMNYFVKINSPKKYAGSTLTYDGKNLFLYFPNTKYGILYQNLQQPTPEDFKNLIAQGFDYNMDHFNYELGRKSKVLGFEIVDLLFRAKQEDLLVHSGISRVYDELSFPLAGELTFKGGQKYLYSFDSIEFNNATPVDRFAISKSSAETMSFWDVNASGLSDGEVEKEANFKFVLSQKIPAGFHLKKIIKQKGAVPAFSAIYEKRPFFIFVTSFKDYGFSLIPAGRGIHIGGKESGELLPNPHLSSYSFVHNEVQYNVTGNIPIDQLVQISEGY